MGLFSRGQRAEEPIDPRWTRAVGLVVSADAPPQGAPSRGPHSQGRIQLVIEAPGLRRRVLSATVRHADTHWLAAGMEAPVAVDPAQPETFVVDWAAVPTMRQQAEANHPALADPFAASRRIAAAIGVTPSEKTAARAERFRAAVSAAAAQPAPPGRLRAVTMVATIRGRFETTGDDDTGGATRSGVTFQANSAAVLAVAVPGSPPYAVYLDKFKFPSRRIVIPGEPMPALVSATDPGDVEVLWDQMPALGDQVAARVADQMHSTNHLMANLTEQHQAAVAAAIAAAVAAGTAQPPPAPAGNPPPPPRPGYPPPGYPPPGYPPPGYPAAGYPPGGNAPGYPPAATAPGYAAPPGAGAMPAHIRQALIENLRRSLAYVDPSQRHRVLDQYRAMGLEITPEELDI